MRKVLFFIAVATMVACNSTNDATVKSASDSSTANENYPYTAAYSSKFEIGDAKHSQAILGLYKDWDDNNLENKANAFADSVTMFFGNGQTFIGTRDSLIAMLQPIRKSMGTVQSTIDAWIPLRSTDKKEDWVAVWFVEHTKDSTGKQDSTAMQETWRINKDGKVDLMFQYQRNKPQNN